MDQSENELRCLLATDLQGHFKDMVLRYQYRLYTFARRLTGTLQDAEDIVQEAFVNAYVSLENYEPQRIRTLKLQAWLYRITLNVYGHHMRHARLHIVPLDLQEDSPLFEIESNDMERPEIVFEQQERQQEMETLISSLPERYRIAITCYYFEHLTYQEIAELLDQPVGTVKSTVSRGVQQLRVLLNTAVKEGKEHALWTNMRPRHNKI